MMKPDFLRILLTTTAALAPVLLAAAPLGQPTPVHVKPDSNAAVITVLPASSEAPAPSSESAPAGWSAVELPGPHEVYVDNKDITKSLDVKPGAAYRVRPSSDAPVLATAADGDSVEITGLRGRWTQLQLNRKVTGYAQLAGGSTPAPATPAPAAASNTPRAETPAPERSTPPPATAAPATGRPAPATRSGDGGIVALPRLFEGKFVSTRAPFRPRRPFDFAIEDSSGARIAYVDLSKLLLTDQIENYVNKTVAVYGVARPVPDSKDIVITVESLQLR